MVLPDRQRDIAHLDARIEFEDDLHPDCHCLRLDRVDIGQATEPQRPQIRLEPDVAGVAQGQRVAVQRTFDVIDCLFDRHREAAAVIGESDRIGGKNHVVGGAVVVKPRAGDDDPVRQVGAQMHQRVIVGGGRVLLPDLQQPRRADAAIDQRPAAHQPQEIRMPSLYRQ